MVRCALKGILTQGQTMYAKEFMFILFYGGEEYVEAAWIPPSTPFLRSYLTKKSR